MSELLNLFNKESDVEFDRRFAQKIHRFRQGFIARVNPISNHPAFFGGHGIASCPVRFVNTDRTEFLGEILGLDEAMVRPQLHSLEGINPEFNVVSDVLNHAVMWACHRALTSKHLRPDEQYQVFEDLIFIMHFRFIGSLSKRSFPRGNGSPKYDEAMYAKLSRKFYLKAEGNWLGVLKRRTSDIYNGKNELESRHSEMEGIDSEAMELDLESNETVIRSLHDYSDTEAVCISISDIQTRIRRMWIGLRNLYFKVIENGDGFESTSQSVEIDGEAVFMDRQRYQEEYLRYGRRIIQDDRSFVNRTLIDIIAKEFRTLPIEPFRDVLYFLSENYYVSNPIGDKTVMGIDKLVDELIIHMFGYLSSSRSKARSIRDVSTIIYQLKGIYTAPRASDPNLLALRRDIEKYTSDVTRIKTQATVATIRTSVMLYVILRVLAKDQLS